MATKNKAAAAGPADKGLRVVAKVDGFRRAGRAWEGTTVVPFADLTAEQVDALKSESMLIVDEVDIEPAKA
jgi:hypothetical protein